MEGGQEAAKRWKNGPKGDWIFVCGGCFAMSFEGLAPKKTLGK